MRSYNSSGGVCCLLSRCGFCSPTAGAVLSAGVTASVCGGVDSVAILLMKNKMERRRAGEVEIEREGTTKFV